MLHHAGYEITTLIVSTFRLDGGAMFGAVPKNLWSKKITPDAENCIALCARILVLRGHGKLILVDVGCGTKWSEKERAIFAINTLPSTQWGFRKEEVSDVLLTHLHFDHAGGISQFGSNGALEPVFPEATIHLQHANLIRAQNPGPKERASYRTENVAPVAGAKKLALVKGIAEVLPGIIVHQVDGHTAGQQWVEVTETGKPPLFFPTDLVPTAHHVSLPYHMGYDMCAEILLKEKEMFLSRAAGENAIVIFEHDCVTEAATISKNAKGEFSYAPVAV